MGLVSNTHTHILGVEGVSLGLAGGQSSTPVSPRLSERTCLEKKNKIKTDEDD